MKNNLHTELREKLRQEFFDYSDDMNHVSPPPEILSVAEWWLSKLDELTPKHNVYNKIKKLTDGVAERLANRDVIQIENPECKNCGLKKSTVDETGHQCLFMPTGYMSHDFSIVNSNVQEEPLPCKVEDTSGDTLEELIEKCGDNFGSLQHYKDGWIAVERDFSMRSKNGNFKHGSGSTRKEAVQNLLKALTKKG